MSRTEERYNIVDTEARWQAAWRCDDATASTETPCRSRVRVTVGPSPNGLTVNQARGCILADVLVRMWRARGIAVTLQLPPGAGWLGLTPARIEDAAPGRTSSAEPIILECQGVPAPPRLRAGRVLGLAPPCAHTAVETYGADSLRLYLLSDTPPTRDMTWSDGGIEGAWRFCHRLWRLGRTAGVFCPDVDDTIPIHSSAAVRSVQCQIAEAVVAVADDMDSLCVHKAIARLRRLAHALAALPRHEPGAPWTLKQGLDALVWLFAPILPHLCADLWTWLGHRTTLSVAPDPVPRPPLPVDNTVTVAVHVNGRRRGELSLPRDSDGEAARRAALALPAVAHHTRGIPPRKIIVVPNRILNVVL